MCIYKDLYIIYVYTYIYIYAISQSYIYRAAFRDPALRMNVAWAKHEFSAQYAGPSTQTPA